MLRATLVGNLGRDPELRYSQDGRPFLQINVASNYRDRAPDGEWMDKTEWIRVTVFGQRAEILSQQLRKGSRVLVDGRLRSRPWLDQSQQPRAGLEMIANEVENLTTRAEDEAAGFQRPGGVPRDPAAGAAAGEGRAPAPRSSAPGDETELEDLPF
jgi:single-strand DNA-binding protein